MHCSLSNLGLQILGITEEHKQNSQDNVLLLARQKYHYFARLLHPDKCKKTEAVGAFITLSKLIDVVSRGIQSPKHIDRPNEEIQKTLLLHAPGDLRSDACCNATETSYVKRELHNRLTWSQNRLVVLAYRMSREMQAPLVQRFSSATKGLLQSEKLIFLPLRNLPSINPYLKKEEMVGTITHEVSDLMQDILCAISGEKGDISSTLDGLLLVPSRSALEGRFPLNGTYFQINEVFLDQATVSNTIKVRKFCQI